MPNAIPPAIVAGSLAVAHAVLPGGLSELPGFGGPQYLQLGDPPARRTTILLAPSLGDRLMARPCHLHRRLSVQPGGGRVENDAYESKDTGGIGTRSVVASNRRTSRLLSYPERGGESGRWRGPHHRNTRIRRPRRRIWFREIDRRLLDHEIDSKPSRQDRGW